MALTLTNIVKGVAWTDQSIPFVLSSTLLDDPDFDPIERSFKVLFELKTLRNDGIYRTYSQVAIPPRPTDSYFLFDAAPLIKSALGINLGTHQATKAAPCDKSIVQYQLICTERYLDQNGDYVSGTPLTLSPYWAIPGQAAEGIEPYIYDYSGNQKAPLHYHQLMTTDLKVRQNEPMTLSWVTTPNVGASLFDESVGDFGTFDMGSLTDYTGITFNTSAVASKTLNNTYKLSGRNLRMNLTGNTYWTTALTAATFFTIPNITVVGGSTYTFEVWYRTAGVIGNFTTSRRWDLNAVANTATITSQTENLNAVFLAGFSWTRSFLTIVVGTSGTIDLTVGVRGTSTNLLDEMANQTVFVDSMSIYENLSQPALAMAGGNIIVDKDLTSEIIYPIPSGYFDDILPNDSFDKSRFDTPIGPYTDILSDGSKQDTTTGFYYNLNGDVGKYYQLELLDTTGNTVGLSEQIYQDDTPCERYKNIRLKWKNSLGGWDYFTFVKSSYGTLNVEKDQYKITRGNIDIGTYTESVSERGYKTLNVNETNIITLNSDWINRETSLWFQDLINSPEVYILNPEYFMKYPSQNEYDIEYPINIENTDIQYLNNNIESKLINVTFDCKLSNNFGVASTNYVIGL